jgi:hypothetical protein
LLFKLIGETIAELVIPTKIPVPVFEHEIILLVLMSTVPEPPVFQIPYRTEAPVP